jgi:ribosome recycling factor
MFHNKDIYVWSANDLCGINRNIIEHDLSVDPNIKPRKQKLQKISEDKVKGAKAEVKQLLSARVIREVAYP